MTINEMTHRQAKPLVAFIHELRGDWDVPGIEYALGKARTLAPAAAVAVAAIKAAGNAHNRTPAVIAMEGAHWRDSEAKPRFVTPDPSERCSICSERQGRCETVWADDHAFLSVAENMRQLTRRAEQ